MGKKRIQKSKETITKMLHVRKDALAKEDRDFLIAWAEKHRAARNRISKRLYHSDELKRKVAYEEIKGNGVQKYFENLRQNCNANTFQKDVETVVANFLSRCERIEYHASKAEQKTDPQTVLVKKKLVSIWKPTKREMIATLKTEKEYVSDNRKSFLAACINKLEKDSGLFPLIQKYQKRFLNGLNKSVYRSDTFRADNMLGKDEVFLEMLDEKSAVAHLKFPEVIRKVKNTYYDAKTGKRTVKTKWKVMQEERRINIPIRFSQKYHGNVEAYADNKIIQNQKKKDECGEEYTQAVHVRNERYYSLVFLPDRDLKIIVTMEQEKAPSFGKSLPTDENAFAGADVNFRDNAIKLDDGWQWQWSNGLLALVNKFLKKLAKRNQNIAKNGNNKKNEWNKELKRQSLHIQQWAESEQTKAAFLLIKHLQKHGKKVLVVEDIEVNGWRLGNGKMSDDLKNKTIKQLLRFGNWKNVLERACKKAGIIFALTNPAYTSQTCPDCGKIDTNNRPFSNKTNKKDIFKCTGEHCHYHKHPDITAARIIKERMANPGIRQKLQWYNKKKDRWEGTKHENREFYQKVYAQSKTV